MYDHRLITSATSGSDNKRARAMAAYSQPVRLIEPGSTVFSAAEIRVVRSCDSAGCSVRRQRGIWQRLRLDYTMK